MFISHLNIIKFIIQTINLLLRPLDKFLYLFYYVLVFICVIVTGFTIFFKLLSLLITNFYIKTIHKILFFAETIILFSLFFSSFSGPVLRHRYSFLYRFRIFMSPFMVSLFLYFSCDPIKKNYLHK